MPRKGSPPQPSRTPRADESLPLEYRAADTRADGTPLPPALPWLFGAYFLLIMVGVAAFHGNGLAMPRGSEMSFDRSVFTSVNAATLTGFQQESPVAAYGPMGRALILVLTVSGSLFSLIVGGWAAVRVLRLPYSDGAVVRFALACEAAVLLVGTAALYGDGNGAFAGLVQSACAFGNSGLFLADGHGRAAAPFGPSHWQLHAVLLPLSVLGGLGMTVLMELFDAALGRRRLSPHAGAVLALSAAAYLVGFVVLFTLRQWDATIGGAPGAFHWEDALTSSSVLALDARTLGHPSTALAVTPWSMIPPFVMLLMIVGASPGGTGGGLKTTTLATLFLGVRAALRGRAPGKSFGAAAVWVALYAAAAFFTVVFLIPIYSDLHADRVAFLTFSALSNVGLFFDPIRPKVGGHLLLSAAMLFGRIMPLVILWWLAEMTADGAGEEGPTLLVG